MIFNDTFFHFRRKSLALRRFNSMPIAMGQLSPDTMENNVLVGHQSTPQTTDIESASLNMSVNCSSATDASTESHTSDLGHVSCSSDGSEKSGSGCGMKKPLFYMEESCSQDSGLGVDRADSRDSKDVVCIFVPLCVF